MADKRVNGLTTTLTAISASQAPHAWLLVDGDGTEIADKTHKMTFEHLETEILGSPVIGTSLDLNGLEIILDEDGDTSITADTDNQIDIKVGGTDRIVIKSTAIVPVTDNDIDLGDSAHKFKDAYFDVVYSASMDITNNITFDEGSHHIINISQEAAGNSGKTLKINGGAGGTGDTNGGDLNLNGGAGDGTGSAGNVCIGKTAGNTEFHSERVLFAKAKQSLNDNSLVSVDTPITEIDSSGGELANGMSDGSQGQIKFIVMTAAASDAVITPTSFGNGTDITMNAVGDSCTLLFTGGFWWVVGQNSIAIG